MRELLFVSTRFLFPVDSGGKIRTTQVLRGLKGSRYRLILASPATRELVEVYQDQLNTVCDEFHWWQMPERGPLFDYTRLRHLIDSLPIPVVTDRHPGSSVVVSQLLANKPRVAVFDFVHSVVLASEAIECASVVFTHNVEAEIFRRHRDNAANPLYRFVWGNQYKKMRRFEQASLSQFDVVVAVAERDAQQFVDEYDLVEPIVIPTGVDLDFFEYCEPNREHDVVFIGSMDWMANQEGMQFFMDSVWGRITKQVPDARMTVVGRSPPDRLVQQARRRNLNWRFTGFVDDIREYVRGAAVSVIPLRVGGGTRLKAFEAMAMGCPIVSTSIGMEGLPAIPDEHYLVADDPQDFADAVCHLLKDTGRRYAVAKQARKFVESGYSYRNAADAFCRACDAAVARHESGRRYDNY